MADVVIAPFDATDDTSGTIQGLVRGEISPNIAAGGISVTAGQTLELQVESNSDVLLVVNATGDAVINAERGTRLYGADNPQALTAGEIYLFVPLAGRHTQELDPPDVALPGSIIIEVTGTGPVTFWAFHLPGGLVGIVHSNSREEIPPAPEPV